MSFLAAAAGLLLLPAAARAEPGASGRPIGSITIVAYNVFEREAFHDPQFLYWAANRFHVRTQDRVVRNELLFAEGDLCDPALLAETERNLRALPFIRRAEVTYEVNEQGTVDVVVRTYDAWTLEVTASFNRVGGNNNARAGLGEQNIGGLGISASGAYSLTNGVPSSTFKFKDSILYGRKVEYSALAITSPGLRSYGLGVNRPFFTSIIPSAFGFNAGYTDVYSGDTRAQLTDVGASYGVAFATSTRRVSRLTLGVRRHIADYGPPVGGMGPGALEDETLNFLKLSGDWQIFRYIKERQIAKFSKEEDINLGLSAQPAVEWSPPYPARSNGSRVMPSLTLTKGFHWEGGRLLLLKAGYQSAYVNGGGNSRIGKAGASFFSRGLPRQTLALHAGFEHAWLLDPLAPITLGEDSGLRGYRSGQYKGARRALLNVEDRIFIRNEIWSVLDLGAVLFFDTGCAWAAGHPPGARDLKSAVGVGLRMAPSRSGSNSPVRVDLAYALNDNRSRSPLLLSILAGHAF